MTPLLTVQSQNGRYECLQTEEKAYTSSSTSPLVHDDEQGNQPSLASVSVPFSFVPDHDVGTAAADAAPLARQILSEQGPTDTSSQPRPLQQQQQQQRALLESFALVAFQFILATTALRGLILSWVGMTCWIVLMAVLVMLLVVVLFRTYSVAAAVSAAAVDHEGELPVSPQPQSERAISYYRLHLYFLLRNALPSSASVMASFQYTVFAAEPVFLQLLTLIGTAVGTLATILYEKYWARYNRGRPLLVLITVLNVAAGLTGLLDLVVIRSVVWQSPSDDKNDHNVAKVTVSLRLLLVVVEVVQSLAGELDYLPTAILSAANVRDQSAIAPDNPAIATPRRDVANIIVEPGGEGVDIDRNSGAVILRNNNNPLPWNPSYNSGMQYASFLSSIDFGFQVAEWIAIPMMTTLHVTRESNWAGLDTFVALCAVLQLGRPLLLCLLQPKTTATTTTSRVRQS